MRGHKDEVTGLSARQEKFCHAYVDNGGNATDAYIVAYGQQAGKIETTKSKACRLRNSTEVDARIRAICDERAKASAVSRETLTRRLWKVFTFNMGRLYKSEGGCDVLKPLSEMTEEELQMIQSFDKNGNPVLVDKMQAVKLLADINGLKSQNTLEIKLGGKLGELLGCRVLPTNDEVIEDAEYSEL